MDGRVGGFGNIGRHRGPRAGARRLGTGWVLVLVANLYGVPVEDLRGGTRGCAKAAFARQLAMYLMHSVYGLSLRQVAGRIGRDRSTVSYAVRLIEELREEPVFDGQMARLENLLREAVQFEAVAGGVGA
jgi:chromosomal replication initiation ATPase DnaA